MKSLLNKDIFTQNRKSLKDTSKDTDNDMYMTESDIEVIDFDGVKNDYIKTLRLEETPKSNDVLYLSDEDKLYFIEFKNGDLRKETYKIKRKIFDSLLMFTDIIGKGVSFTREHMQYILVYNREKCKESVERKEKKLSKDKVQESEGLTLIQSSVSNWGNYNMDILGIRKQFRGLYFKEVYTYTKDEFENAFVSKMKIK